MAWNSLLENIEARDQKLEAAGEIHRFNRDVAEALARIQEKFKSIPEDLGRDVNSVQSLLRKHEGFENDLVALEAQLQVCLSLSCFRMNLVIFVKRKLWWMMDILYRISIQFLLIRKLF